MIQEAAVDRLAAFFLQSWFCVLINQTQRSEQRKAARSEYAEKITGCSHELGLNYRHFFYFSCVYTLKTES